MDSYNDLTEEEIQARLAGEAVRGPRAFRGRILAPLSRGLRDIRNKVISAEDTAGFHDCALLHILAEAHAETPDGRLAKRRALIAATDDVQGFRATISMALDDFADEDIIAARRLVDSILGLVTQAEVALAEKKSEQADALPMTPPPMMTPSASGDSPNTPDGAPTLSDGN